jgi:hypothetical protein
MLLYGIQLWFIISSWTVFVVALSGLLKTQSMGYNIKYRTKEADYIFDLCHLTISCNISIYRLQRIFRAAYNSLTIRRLLSSGTGMVFSKASTSAVGTPAMAAISSWLNFKATRILLAQAPTEDSGKYVIVGPLTFGIAFQYIK